MTASKFILPIILFVLTLAAGFWVSKTGKPYNTGTFTLHKLLALAAVVFVTIAITDVLKTTHAQPLVIVLVVLAGLSVIALFGTGALMSIQKTVSSIWLFVHRVAPFLLAGSSISAILLLIKTV
ncbi:MAG TPA: hypothetical protein DIW44_04200 [Anaerolineaceae bacterium]|nr:hypothetical protein [Anaerolineaceae bacterium]